MLRCAACDFRDRDHGCHDTAVRGSGSRAIRAAQASACTHRAALPGKLDPVGDPHRPERCWERQGRNGNRRGLPSQGIGVPHGCNPQFPPPRLAYCPYGGLSRRLSEFHRLGIWPDSEFPIDSPALPAFRHAARLPCRPPDSRCRNSHCAPTPGCKRPTGSGEFATAPQRLRIGLRT